MSATVSEQAILELLDREAIRDCLHRYSRGIDRRDFDLLKTVFWQDAIDEHGAYNGPVSEFWAWVDQRTKHWDRTMHALAQTIIDLDGEEASAETYFTAYHKKPRPDGTWFDEYVGGRYIDRMVKKSNEWRIQHRIVAFEWFRHMPDSSDWTNSPFGAAHRGARMPEDPIYHPSRGAVRISKELNAP
jgi:3-phenylpropionate/cinnamic acid dioxygenase small subunit